MAKNKQPKPRKLSKSILRVCLAFGVCLSLGVGILSVTVFTRDMMDSNREYLSSILRYAAMDLDADDMEECIKTGVISPKMEETQLVLNQLKEYYQIEYIYILKPLREKGPDNMLYVMTGVTVQEILDDPDQTMLGDLSGDEYGVEVSRYYIKCMHSGSEIRYFANNTAFGYMYTGMLPIINSSGKTIAILSADISIQALASTVIIYSLCCLAGCMAFTALFMLLLYRWMTRRVIRPVMEMEKSARTFVDASHCDASPDELSFTAPEIDTQDEIQSLSDTLCKMTDDVKTYLVNAVTQAKEKQRLASELSVATQIQADMLPCIFPAFPGVEEFDIYATMNPAKEVGGDFYDYFLVDENHLCMVIADVSGKGVPAALFMVIAKTLIKNRAMAGGTPSEILADVNEQLCEGNKAQLFVTVWLAIVDIHTGEGVAANAGHEDPVIRRANGPFELVKYRHSPAVACMEGMRFRQHDFKLESGDILFVYTDGVPEATNSDNELFGTGRMLDSLNSRNDAPIQRILIGLKSDIETFVGQAPQFDDLTMLAMVFYGENKKDA